MFFSKRTGTMLAASLGVSIFGTTTLIQASSHLDMQSVIVEDEKLKTMKQAVQLVGAEAAQELRAVDAVSTETIIAQINSNSDDAEEEYSGKVYLSSDLVIVDNNNSSSSDQTVGLRFNNLMIPQGAVITHAAIKFKAVSVDGLNTNNEKASFFIEAQYDDDVLPFSDTSYDISSRPQTAATVGWTPLSWHSGISYDTPNLATMVQEVVDRRGWIKGNSMAFLITGSGSRSSSSYEEGVAPELTIQYELPFATLAQRI